MEELKVLELFSKESKYQEAIENYEKALKIDEQYFGDSFNNKTIA